MAFTLQSAFGAFVPANRDNILPLPALAGFSSQDNTAIANILAGNGMPQAYDFRALANTTAADANSVVLDLSARGVTFPAGNIRVIRTDTWFRTVGSTTDAGFISAYDVIIGGTNPTRVAPGTNNVFRLVNFITASNTIVSGAQINTTPTPDTVEIQITGIAATINWDVRVYCFPLVALA